MLGQLLLGACPIDVARRLMRVEGATSWVVLLDKTENTSSAVATLRAKLPADDFEVVRLGWR